MKKRILSAFLCLCMMLTLAPAAFASNEGDPATPSTGENTPTTGGGTSEENIFQIDIASSELPAGGKVEGLGVNTETANTFTFTGEIPSEYFENKAEIAFTLTFLKEENTPTVTGKFTLNKDDKTKVDVNWATDAQLPEKYQSFEIASSMTATPSTGGDKPTTPDTPASPVDAATLTVAAAPLEDHAKTNPVAKDKLISNYKLVANPADKPATVEGKTNEFSQTLTISGTDLVKHTNAQDTEGYWVGFFAAAPAGSVALNCTKEGNKTKVLKEKFDDVSGKQGISVYYNRAGVKKDTCILEWLGEKDAVIATVTYTISMEDVHYVGEPQAPAKNDYEITVVIDKVTHTIKPVIGEAVNDKFPVTFEGEIPESAFTGTGSEKTVEIGLKVVPKAANASKPETTFGGKLTLKNGTVSINITEANRIASEWGYSIVNDSETAIKVATGEVSAPMKLVSASYGVDGQKDPVDLKAVFDKDDAKVINLTGTISEALLADGKEVGGKLVYTLGGSAEESYPFLLFFKDGKIDGKASGTAKLPDGYIINYAGIVVTKANVEAKPPVTGDAAQITDPTAKAEAKKVAGTVKTDEMDKIVSNNEQLDKIADEAKDAGHTVEVYLEINPVAYEITGPKPTFTLDITPKYQVKDAKDQPVPGKTGELKVDKPVEISVVLPSGFAKANDPDVYAKHTHDNKTYIRHVIVDGTRKGTFTMNGFSEVEFYKDTRKVTVKYNGKNEKSIVEYSLANVDGKLPKDSDGNKTFKGWALKENATTADYSDTFTTDMLDAMIKAAGGKTLNLYPVFAESGSTDKPSSSGGGGGGKRPSSSDDKKPTTPTTPSDYGNNPSTPSTPASKTGFSDVVAGGWYESAVQYMKDNGLMAGTSATTFAPDATTTRGMIVTILYRLEKEPAAAAASSFSDIAAGEWYSDAVAWAAANNIVSGYENGTFGAGDVITREQMAAILFRYASFKGYDVTKTADLSAFADAAQVSAYAADAMKWANAAGLISGTSATTLAPAGSATRAQAASILMRFCENVAK